jgi:hypothetical protein
MISGLLILLMLAPLSTMGSTSTPPKWRSFKGAYFVVSYPPGFKARKSLPSNSFAGQYDSAFFTALDGSVEFYVFSPLWNGVPQDIERDPQTEEVVSQDLEQKGSVKTRRVTLRAKNNSYMRSFEDKENTKTNNRTVFGIKYRDLSAYDTYRQHYLRFKKSLQQFAD